MSLIDLPAERAALACTMLNAGALDDLRALGLKPSHFHRPAHGVLWGCIVLHDVFDLGSFFGRHEAELKSAGVSITEVMSIQGAPAHLSKALTYGQAVIASYRCRSLREVCAEVVEGLAAGELDFDAAGEMYDRKFTEARDDANDGSEPESLESMMHGWLKDRRAVLTGEAMPRVISSGMRALDALMPLGLGHQVIVAGRPKMGKAAPLDSLVRAPGRWRKMVDLKVGDPVSSVDGAPSVVTGVFPQGERQVFRVTFSDGRSAEVCDEHLWSVHCRHWDEPRVLSTGRVRDLLARKRYQKRIWIDAPSGDDGAREAGLPVDPWALGALLGDGCLGQSSIAISTPKPELAKLVAERTGVRAVQRNSPYDFGLTTLRGQPSPLLDALRRLGLQGKRSWEKHIPRAYLDGSRRQREELLRGLLDTDGWVEKTGTVKFSSASRELAEGVQELARSLGAWCALRTKEPTYTYRGEHKRGRTAYVLTISHPRRAEWLTLPEKRERAAHKSARGRRLTFTSIEPTRRTQTQCISVSHPSSLYITDEYVVTHNTQFALTVAMNVARHHGPVLFCSAEMGRAALQERIADHELDHSTLQRFDHGAARLVVKAGQCKDLFFDYRNRTAQKVEGSVRRWHRKKKLALVVIDYLQLLGGDDKDERQRIASASGRFKRMAADLEVPLLTLAQLNRDCEKRDDKRPQAWDLKGSGDIEQDADSILMLYRGSVYGDEGYPEHRCEALLRASRWAPAGRAFLQWTPGSGWFTDEEMR